MNAVLETAIAAHQAGACPIRAMTDGSKRPLGNWAEWQTRRPTLEQIQNWFGDGHPGLGIVCGEVSGRLECLEIEGQVMREVWPQLKERLAQAGLLDLLTLVAGGYSEQSPARGVHFIYRIDGESEMPGNTKLASRPIPGTSQVQTMIETRSEGGFIVVAPSNGSTHPTGDPWVMLAGGWSTVRTMTRDRARRRGAHLRVVRRDASDPSASATEHPTRGGRGRVDRHSADGMDQHEPYRGRAGPLRMAVPRLGRDGGTVAATGQGPWLVLSEGQPQLEAARVLDQYAVHGWWSTHHDV